MTNFVSTLHKFITDLNRYYPNESCEKFLNIYDSLDMNKILLKLLHVMRKNVVKLESKDNSLFEHELVIIPGINTSLLWNKLTSGQQNKCWTYLQILYFNADLIEKITNNKQDDFNPYEGICPDKKLEDYSVNDLVETINMEDEEIGTPGLESLAKMFNLDKMFDLDKLKEQLSNMTDEEMNNASEGIKKLLGNNLDERSTELVTNMISEIKTELKNEKIDKNANPFEIINKIANNVATNVRPKINDADMQKLFNATQNNTSGFNPMDMMKKFGINDKASMEKLMENPQALQKMFSQMMPPSNATNKEKLKQSIKNKQMNRYGKK